MHGHLNVKVCILLVLITQFAISFFLGGGFVVECVKFHSETKRSRNATVSAMLVNCMVSVDCTGVRCFECGAARRCIQRQDCKH